MILKINDRIRQRTINFFNDFKLSLKYDAVGSTFSFGFYFNPENPEHKELMCIGHYHTCTLEYNNELLLTGQILSQGFSSDTTFQYARIAGYSKAGVLEDCNVPLSAYPLQNDGLSLSEIAQKLLSPFNIKMVVDSDVASKMNSKFDTSLAGETDTVKSYLASLASQKNIVLSHNEAGDLVFTKAKTDRTSIFDFEKALPATSMSLDFNGQAMHSHITVMKQADSEGGNAGEFTIRNPFVINSVYRPKVVKQSSGKDSDTEEAAKTALAEELRNVKVKINLDRWILNGKIVKPNNMITVINPDIFLFKKTKLFIESVDFSGNEKEQTCTLNCVLPEVYNQQPPEYIWKGVNLH